MRVQFRSWINILAYTMWKKNVTSTHNQYQYIHGYASIVVCRNTGQPVKIAMMEGGWGPSVLRSYNEDNLPNCQSNLEERSFFQFTDVIEAN